MSCNNINEVLEVWIEFIDCLEYDDNRLTEIVAVMMIDDKELLIDSLSFVTVSS